MLHIKADRNELVLGVPSHHPLWRDRLFLIAFSVAAGLHLLAMALFHIPNLLLSERPSPVPAAVVADIHWMTDGSAEASLNARLRGIWMPPRSTPPPLPALHTVPILSRQLPILPMINNDPFTTIKMAPSTSPALQRSHPQQEWLQSKQPLLEFSGPLAEEQLLTTPDLSSLPKIPRDQLIRYTVLLDQRRGRILWLESQAGASAIPLLSQLRFKPRMNGSLVKGEMELTIP